MGKILRPGCNIGMEKRWSLPKRLNIVVSVIIITIVAAFAVSMNLFARKERNDVAVRESDSLLNSISNNIFSEMERYKALSRLIMIDDNLVTYLRADSEDVSLGMINDAKYGIFGILNATENVDSVFVFREDGKYLSTNRGEYLFNFERMDNPIWKEDILSAQGRPIFSVNGNNAIYKRNGSSVITIGRAIYDIYTQQRTGIMMMNISDAMLELTIDSARNPNVCFLEPDGTFVAGNHELEAMYDEDFASSSVVHKVIRTSEGRVLVSGYMLDNMPLVIICSQQIDGRFFPKQTGLMLIFLFIVFAVAMFIAGTFITRNITNPVFALTDAMERNRSLGTLEKIDVSIPQNEIGLLEDSYNNMIEHVNELIQALLEKEKTIQKAEMRVLHEQIKPHFLYNSLETIGFMAMDAGADNVHSALETLGAFYRNFLSKGDREIPLRREVQIVKDYLSLQKLRYGDIIEDEYDIAEDTCECIIPKLILQPLVENSIYHGIKLKGEPGTIRITSRLDGDMLHIYVRDTGVGMSQKQIDWILQRSANGTAADDEPVEMQSFGLRGTIERIRCFCDNQDVVRIRSEEGEYTEIELIIQQKSIGGMEDEYRQKVSGNDY